MRDIENKEDLTLLMNTFYGKVLKDSLLSPFFKNLNFDEHLPQIVRFWAFVLLDETGYTTNVVEKHMHMRLKQEHFDRWLALFHETASELFEGEKTEMAKQRATLIGWTIASKMN